LTRLRIRRGVQFMRLSLWNFLRSCYFPSVNGKGKYVLGLMKHRIVTAHGEWKCSCTNCSPGSRGNEWSASRPGHITHNRRAPEPVWTFWRTEKSLLPGLNITWWGCLLSILRTEQETESLWGKRTDWKILLNEIFLSYPCTRHEGVWYRRGMVGFTLSQATMALRESRGIALLYFRPLH